jgi:hypothetical protein
MELFQQLGIEIDDLWREKDYNEELFPTIAADALRRAGLPAKVSAWDVVDWSLKQTELPRQRDVNAKFADPPMTIYSGPRFHIDVYFWFEGTTATHQHGFCGAFQVLLGSSIHSWHLWECRDAINTFCEIGDISLKVCEILNVGDVQEIQAGKQYIHSLFHLDQPSATIVVRTDRSPLHLPQFSYHKPSIAIDPFFEQETTAKKLQVMSALIRADHADADRWISDWIEASDFHTTFIILFQLRGLLKSNQLDRMFRPDAARSRFLGFFETAGRVHGKRAEELKAVFEHAEMLDEIVNRRSYVTNPEHRFFMALLLNVDGRDRIFSLIKQRFADDDPVEKVLDWTFDLAQTRVMGVDNSNALGVPDFGEAEMFVLENILRGRSDGEITQSYLTENPHADQTAINEAISRISAAVIFRPLLA